METLPVVWELLLDEDQQLVSSAGKLLNRGQSRLRNDVIKSFFSSKGTFKEIVFKLQICFLHKDEEKSTSRNSSLGAIINLSALLLYTMTDKGTSGF